MAAGTIITVLSNIPWGQVMENAPKVAILAIRFWSAVTRNTPTQSRDASANTDVNAGLSDPEFLNRHLDGLEKRILHLEKHMSASADLIKALAEQNTQLVAQVEKSSVRLLRLTITTAIGAVCLVGSIVYLLLRP